MDGAISIVVHHGGKFDSTYGLCRQAYKTYVDGKISTFYNYDPDKVSYFEILQIAKELGHTGLCKLHFKSPLKTIDAGCMLLYDDSQVNTLLHEAKETKSIIIYVEDVEEQLEVNDEAGNIEQLSHQDLNDLADLGIDIEDEWGVNVGQDIGMDTSGHGNLDKENVDDIPQTDYDIEFDLDEMSEVNSLEHISENDDDEELLEVRKRKLKLKKDMDKIREEHAAGNLDDEEVPNSFEGTTAAGNDVEDDEPYLGSSDYDTPNDSDDESEKKHKKSLPVFNPNTEISKIKFEVGLRFSGPKQLKEAVRNYAVANAVSLKFMINKPNKIQVICSEGCPWKLFASWMNKERSFQVKTLCDNHMCCRAASVRMATSSWLAKIYGNKIREMPSWRSKDFVREVDQTYNIKVTRLQCYRAKKKALSEVESGLIEHYSYLRSYGKEILRADKRNTVKLSVEREGPDGQATFKRMYISFYALKKGWTSGCRPVLGLDGSFLKSYCCGEILSAVGRDSNNQMFPVAWAVVEVECTDSWTWFLEILKDDLELSNVGNRLTLLTGNKCTIH